MLVYIRIVHRNTISKMEDTTTKDLKISYDNENGQRINAEYDTIMDFMDVMESDNVDIPMMDYENVEADFFENPLHHKHFNTIADLYNHCVEIMKWLWNQDFIKKTEEK